MPLLALSPSPAGWIILAVAWVGHACLWTWLLNVLYSQRLPKQFLKPWRLFTGFMIALGYPLFLYAWYAFNQIVPYDHNSADPRHFYFDVYFLPILFLGGIVFPIITVRKQFRRDPASVVQRSAVIRDWRADRRLLGGDGKFHHLAKLAFNDIFRVEFTALTLKLPTLPAAWDGLTILHLTDFHFHGTPNKEFFQRILDEIKMQPIPDVIVLTGDYFDSDAHKPWMDELLSQLDWTEEAFAILGNHDVPHDPAGIRDQLSSLGFTVVSNRWMETTIRGERVAVGGNELPWLRPGPGIQDAPKDCFRLGLSHAPDQFPTWAVQSEIDLLFCGHVHGGQIRLPVIGSIFVPSVHSRAYDEGVFEKDSTTMVVSRGLSGKEPLRFRCPAQVVTVTLKMLKQE